MPVRLPYGGDLGAAEPADLAHLQPRVGGGGAKGGGEDKEHRNKYSTGEKVVEEPGRMVPLVIGEKTARQRTEKQEPE